MAGYREDGVRPLRGACCKNEKQRTQTVEGQEEKLCEKGQTL